MPSELSDVRNFVVNAKPAKDNAQYAEWETAKIVILLKCPNAELSLELAKKELSHRGWELLGFEYKATLYRDRVKNEGGEIYEAFLKAESGEIYFKILPNFIFSGNKEPKILCPARVTETFFDRVIESAGGKRADSLHSFPSGQKNADYLIYDYVFELKDVQEEALEKEIRQEKLAKLFDRYFPYDKEVFIDPKVLSQDDYPKYLNIITSPIKGSIKSAARQVKATKKLLSDQELRGGLIFLNTGYGSCHHSLFDEQVRRIADKDTSQFDEVITLSIWHEHGKMDSYVFYEFTPKESKCLVVQNIISSFGKHFEQMMTKMMKGELTKFDELLVPLKPVSFEYGGKSYVWLPEIVKRS